MDEFEKLKIEIEIIRNMILIDLEKTDLSQEEEAKLRRRIESLRKKQERLKNMLRK